MLGGQVERVGECKTIESKMDWEDVRGRENEE